MWLGLGMAGRDPIGHRKIKIQMKNVFKFSLIACHPVHFLWFWSQTPPPPPGHFQNHENENSPVHYALFFCEETGCGWVWEWLVGIQ